MDNFIRILEQYGAIFGLLLVLGLSPLFNKLGANQSGWAELSSLFHTKTIQTGQKFNLVFGYVKKFVPFSFNGMASLIVNDEGVQLTVSRIKTLQIPNSIFIPWSKIIFAAEEKQWDRTKYFTFEIKGLPDTTLNFYGKAGKSAYEKYCEINEHLIN